MCKNTTPFGFRFRESRLWRGQQRSYRILVVNAETHFFLKSLRTAGTGSKKPRQRTGKAERPSENTFAQTRGTSTLRG